MNEFLSDITKFKKLHIPSGKEFNYIHNQQLRLTKFLKELEKKGVLSKVEYDILVPAGTQPSVLYGLSKIHKPTINGTPKLRPILSAINTPTYQLAKFFVKILKPFTTN